MVHAAILRVEGEHRFATHGHMLMAHLQYFAIHKNLDAMVEQLCAPNVRAKMTNEENPALYISLESWASTFKTTVHIIRQSKFCAKLKQTIKRVGTGEGKGIFLTLY